MSKEIFYTICLLILVVFLGNGCNHSEKDVEKEKADQLKNNLTIYCENSLAPLLQQLKPQFEQKYSCRLKLVNDCSQNLIGLINFTKQGDLFIPDSYSALSILRQNSAVDITDSIFIGYNSLVLVVANDNPLNITGDLIQLADNGISLIIANPESSSLGFQTKNLLSNYNFENSNLFENVIKNVVQLSIDSKGMVKDVSKGKADVAITWFSDLYQESNSNLIDSVLLSQEYTTEVYAGVLSCTQNPILAKYFIDFVSSDKGSAVAKQYGFHKRKSPVF
ncbi:MAG: substrate-binding domain-containing protein [Marinilabiliaceae bacterium]|nr:substrate-binding domain-containing protein [Marinilabiliaceae bacterium]